MALTLVLPGELRVHKVIEKEAIERASLEGTEEVDISLHGHGEHVEDLLLDALDLALAELLDHLGWRGETLRRGGDRAEGWYFYP